MRLLLVVVSLSLLPPASVATGSDQYAWTAASQYSSIDDMDEYFSVAQTEIMRFSASRNIPAPRHFRYANEGTHVKTGCSKTPVDSKTVFFFCPIDDTVYASAETMWKLYQIAWYGPMVALIHEAGHARQNDRGKVAISPDTILGVEGQADCFAGVWAKAAPRSLHGRLSPGSHGIVALLGSAEHDEQKMVAMGMYRTHPEPGERLNRYETGFASGELSVCDPFAVTKVSR